jgi:hypothetical protein
VLNLVLQIYSNKGLNDYKIVLKAICEVITNFDQLSKLLEIFDKYYIDYRDLLINYCKEFRDCK